jgi:hypothetical protein
VPGLKARIRESMLASAIAFVWLSGWAIGSVASIAKGDPRSAHWVLLVFYWFCGLPLGLDLVVGSPDYAGQPGFRWVCRDEATALIYAVWMAAIPPVLLVLNRSPRRRAVGLRALGGPENRQITLLARVLLASPTLLLALAPNPALYLNYAAFVGSDPAPAEVEFQGWMSALCLLVALAVPIIVAYLSRISPLDFMLLSFALVQVAWLQGKRSILAISAMAVLHVVWQKSRLRGMQLVMGAAGIVFLVAAASVVYQRNVRAMDASDLSALYDGVRIDFGRDAVIKQAIYGELHPEFAILEHRAQSVLFDLTFYVPRGAWPSKPWPYAVYATSTMLGRRDPEHLGWGITTSVLDEMLANFGWPGALLGPLWLALLCRWGDARLPASLSTGTLMVVSLFLAVQLAAFMVLFLVWCGLLMAGPRLGGGPRNQAGAHLRPSGRQVVGAPRYATRSPGKAPPARLQNAG